MQINPFFQQSNKLQNKYLVLDNPCNDVTNSESKHIHNSTEKLSSNPRLSKAMKLLPNKSLNISEIAYAVGFNDPKYFSRCFKREFGLSPKDFREFRLKNMTLESDWEFDENFISKANDIVLENIAQPAFGVDELASELNVSYSTLYRKIKTMSGVSPCDFIRKARIKNAIKMFSQKSLSFADIAFASGFCSYSYFSRCFKSEFGLFPSEYAQNLRMG